MKESFEKLPNKRAESIGGNTNKSRAVHRVIEEPHQTTEYDVDDLIKELSGEESWRKR
jgi:hypothetical protein